MANNHSKYQVIRVTPTLDTSAYGSGDVLFNGTEIPNAVLGKGACAKLIHMSVIDKSDETYDNWFILSENTITLGTQNASANISDADFITAKVTGAAKQDADQQGTGTIIDNLKVLQVLSSSGHNENSNPVQILQAASDSTSVYVSAIVSSGTPTFAADDLELILHIERQ